jgi:ABC-2 type transport system ATP-binding protein
MEYTITTTDLTKKFGSFTAVNKVNLNIKAGEIYGFLGPNGSGKSTTIRMLCGILEPSSGSGKVLGYDIARQSELIKKRIGYMSQKFSLYDDLTVVENLDFFGGLYDIPTKERSDRIHKMIELTNLGNYRKTPAGQLSGGTRQGLALACAIISEPAILFLDEPTSGVSPTGRREFFKIIRGLAEKGTTVMLSTHFMDEAERCSNIAFISEGNLIANDSPSNLKRNIIPGYMVEMEIPNIMNRISELHKLPGIIESSVHGALIHILMEDQQYIPDLETHFGLKAEMITPSLEDVFLALSKKHRSSKDQLQ